MSAKTYTLDAVKNGGDARTAQYFTDHGLTAEQVANARINFPRMGIEIIRVFEDDLPVSPADLAPFGVTP